MAVIAIMSNSDEERIKVKEVVLAYTKQSDLKFVEYNVGGRHKADLMGEVNGDVIAKAIDLLIASDWLETGWDEFSSAELIAFCHRATPGFPFIIITGAQISEDDIENILTTHIYPAQYFLVKDHELAKTMVEEIDRLCQKD
ncbi:MAG: hypothetical protein IJ849_06070 [Selenomonadaceae bacterium]|nr:hypothetical protein [Selenomonadaceae bacterium]